MARTTKEIPPLEENDLEAMGARQMLLRLRSCYKITTLERQSADDAIYVRAELDMIVSSTKNVRQFLDGTKHIHYKDYRYDRANKLKSVKAYFA